MSEDIKERAEKDKIKTASDGTREKGSRSNRIDAVKSEDRSPDIEENFDVENEEPYQDLTDGSSGISSTEHADAFSSGTASGGRLDMESPDQVHSAASPFRGVSSSRVGVMPGIRTTVGSGRKRYTVKSVSKSSHVDTRKIKVRDVSSDTFAPPREPAKNPLKTGFEHKEHIPKSKKRVAVKSAGAALSIAGTVSYAAGGVVGTVAKARNAGDNSLYSGEASADEYGEKQITGAASSTARKSASAVKSGVRTAKNGVEKTMRSMIRNSGKTAEKAANHTAKATIKTAGTAAKSSIKTAKQTVKVSERAVKTTAKTAKTAAKAARTAAQATVKTSTVAADLTTKAVAAVSKAIAAITTALTEFIASGGWAIMLAVAAVILVVTIVVMIIALVQNDLSTPYQWMPDLEDAMNEIAVEYDDYLIYIAGGEDTFYAYEMIDYGYTEKPVWIDPDFNIYDTIWPEVTALYMARVWDFGNNSNIPEDVDGTSLRECFTAMFDKIDCWEEEREGNDGSTVVCLCYEFSYKTFETAAESLGLGEYQIWFANTLYTEDWIAAVNDCAPSRGVSAP